MLKLLKQPLSRLCIANVLILEIVYGLFCAVLLMNSSDSTAECASMAVGVISVFLLAVLISNMPLPVALREVILTLTALLYGFLAISSFMTHSSISFLSLSEALKTTPLVDIALLSREYTPPSVILGSMLGYLFILGIALGFAAHDRRLGCAQKVSIPATSIYFVSFLSIVTFNINSREPFSSLTSAMMHHPLSPLCKRPVAHSSNRDRIGKSDVDWPSGECRPNIFFVMMESMNPMFIGRRGPGGEAVTPNLDSIRTNSVWLENFFGNGVYSFVGQLSTLESMYPTITGKPSSVYLHKGMAALPAILKGCGYQTWFFTAHQNLFYNSPSIFSNHLGFEQTIAMDPKLLGSQYESFFWNWGLQDDKFYSVCFRMMFAEKDDRPKFAVLANISNHLPFVLPNQLRKLKPYPKTSLERYMDSVAFADSSLPCFFDELRKRGLERSSIVVLIGDHGFPMGEHQNYLNISKAYEENFRTVGAILWSGHLRPKIVEQAFSQVDVAPTLLGLIGIQAPPSFRGRSIFSKDSEKNVALCAQSYDGGYVCAFSSGYLLRYACQTRVMEFQPWHSTPKAATPPVGLEGRLRESLSSMANDIISMESRP